MPTHDRNVFLSDELLDRLKEAGLVPDLSQEIVITLAYNAPAKIEWRGFADDRLERVIDAGLLAEAAQNPVGST